MPIVQAEQWPLKDIRSQYQEPVNVTLQRKRIFGDVINALDRRSWIIQPILLSKHKYPCKREAERDLIDTKRESNVTAEAKTGVMQPQTKEHWQPPEATKGKEWILPQMCRGSTALPAP